MTDSVRSHRSIGEVLHELEAEFPEVTISKIRFLESQGLLNPERTASGYRKFRDDDVDRLRWVLVQQRDNFLPLRVIKQRLDSDDWRSDTIDGASATTSPTSGANSAASRGASPDRTSQDASAAALAPRSRPLDLGPTDIEFTLTELAEASKLEIAQIRDLQKFGLLEPSHADPPTFDGDALIIAKAAAGFLSHGLEARHLKAFRIAAEREAGTLEQMAIPVAKAGNAGARGRAVDLANELVGLGGVLREAMIRRYLRSSLGID